MFKKFLARKMVGFSVQQLTAMLKGRFILVFDDGEMLTTARETIYSSIFWVFHKENPEMPMLKAHHIRNFLGEFQENGIEWKTKKYYNSKTHLEVGNVIYWDAHKVRNRDKPHRFDKPLCLLFYQTINNIYNFLASLDGYELSFNDKDYLAIRFHPFVDAAQRALTPNPKVISDKTKEVLNFVKTSPDFDNNPLAKAVRGGLVRELQFIQCIFVRGFIEDNDSHIFEEPILRGFIDGLTQFENFIESRSASKSLLYNKKVIQFVEYFSRTLQIQAMIVKNLHKGDCGSNSYIRWTVQPPLFDVGTGRVLREGDLKNIRGKYYKLNPEDKDLMVIDVNDTHLIGKTIFMRSPVAGCRHPDPHGICSYCFGDIAPSVDEHNLGMQCGADIADKQTSAVLSQKHAQSSSIADPVVIDDSNKHIFTTNAERDSFIIVDSLIGKDYYIILSKNECPGFIELDYINSVDEIGSISHVSELTCVTFVIRGKDFEDRYTVEVALGSRRSSLSKQMLAYIKEHKPVIKDNSYEISMKNWRGKAPFSILPLSQESPYIRATKIQSLVLGDSKNISDRDTPDAPRALLQKLYDLLNTGQNINLALIEVIVYSLMVRNTKEGDYFLPKEGDRMGLGINSKVMAMRSLGGLMALEDHAKVILDVDSYEDRPRLDHGFDVLLKPQEHVKNYDPESFESDW